MESELFVVMLARVHAAACVALVLVLAARIPCRRLFGAQIAYRLWMIVPAAAVAGLFPSLADFEVSWAPHLSKQSQPSVAFRLLQANAFFGDEAPLLLAIWAFGAGVLIAAIIAAERRFRRRARVGLAGPAVVGVAAPRLVVPYNFEKQFTKAERAIICRHERVHIDSGHPTANVIAAAIQVLFWFNPLIHIAASLSHADQELACDASVLERRSCDRRLYGEVLLKATDIFSSAPLGCALADNSGNLETRIRELSRNDVNVTHYVTGIVAVGFTTAILLMALWINVPEAGFSHLSMVGAAKPSLKVSNRRGPTNIYTREQISLRL